MHARHRFHRFVLAAGLSLLPVLPAVAAGVDAALAERLGADQHGMRPYVLAILETGPSRVPDGPERDAMFAGHFANMERLAKMGKLALAGPFQKHPDGWRGLFVFAVEDIEEARALTATDPVIVNGEMVAEFHRWYGSAALMMIPELHDQLVPPSAGAQPAAVEARYDVRVERTHPMRVSVTASLPLSDGRIRMTESWPGNVPGVDEGGWPALVEDLQVWDAAGGRLAVEADGPAGWRLADADVDAVRVTYAVDFAGVADHAWPAPRETAYGTADRFVALGRSLFVTTDSGAEPRVTFQLPVGWTVAAPWTPDGDGGFRVESMAALVENLVFIGRTPPVRVEAGAFGVDVVAFGHWTAVEDEVAAALQASLRDFVRRMGYDGDGRYLVALLPAVERGGEAFRDSFALNWNETPTAANRADWGNIIAHELFHFWNGTRLRGADYAATQWFQEGFTEYMANTTLLATGQVTAGEFHARLARHVDNYRKLQTPLDAPGTRKGPPLYSGGALVALAWDGMIRDATGGARSLDDVMRELWRRTDGGAEPYGWTDIEAALGATAPGDWAAFHARHVAGTEPLPLDAIFGARGLRLSVDAEGQAVVAAGE